MYEAKTARAIIDGLNDWEIQSISPSKKGRNAWDVTIGSAPRIVGDLLPSYDVGSDEGFTFSLEPREGAAEMDETVRLRRNPSSDGEADGIVMWGLLTCAYESRERGIFAGTIAFFEEEDEGDALMALAETEERRLVIDRALDSIDQSIILLDGNGGHVVAQAERILEQTRRLQTILAEGIAIQKAEL